MLPESLQAVCAAVYCWIPCLWQHVLHLVCTECVTTKTGFCPVCKEPFNVDEFQLLQPGVLYEWTWNLREKPLIQNFRYCYKGWRKPSVSVQVDGRLPSAAGNVPMRPGVHPAIQRRRPNGGHECIYDATATHRNCLLRLEQHDESVVVSESSWCAKWQRRAEACPEEESKLIYVINQLQDL